MNVKRCDEKKGTTDFLEGNRWQAETRLDCVVDWDDGYRVSERWLMRV